MGDDGRRNSHKEHKMARRASANDDGGGSARRGNSFDKAAVEAFISRVENLDNDLASEKGSYAKRCLEIRQDKDAVYDEAKNAGISKKALKAKVRKRSLQRQIESVREGLEGEDQDAFDMLEQSLGELGRAAAARSRAEADA
jgi:uncharacterized protein (UPF0335 family)